MRNVSFSHDFASTAVRLFEVRKGRGGSARARGPNEWVFLAGKKQKVDEAMLEEMKAGGVVIKGDRFGGCGG